jgi:hypothetical protein
MLTGTIRIILTGTIRITLTGTIRIMLTGTIRIMLTGTIRIMLNRYHTYHVKQVPYVQPQKPHFSRFVISITVQLSV